jgi:magnesium transporter
VSVSPAGALPGHLIDVEGRSYDVTPETVASLVGASTRFWLDLHGDPGAQDELLRRTFGFHPLAVEDAEHFGQRPKIDTYDGFSFLVVYGPNRDGHLVEVHAFYNETFLVTIHQDPCPMLAALADRIHQRAVPADHVMLLYRVIDSLVDGYFPVLAELDDRIDDLEDEILVRPTEKQLGQLFDMKRSLIALRKVVTPQRDMMASLLSETDLLPGMTSDAERYFRDLYDHLIRISELVDSYRDLLTGALDTHLSTVSNRLNAVMKQLTIIATVFLPLSFLTGFFGQNFGWMVNRLGSLGAFLALGLGSQVVVTVGLLVFFRRRGWLGSDGTLPSNDPPSRNRMPRDGRWKSLAPHRGDLPAPGTAAPAPLSGWRPSDETVAAHVDPGHTSPG